MKIKYDHAYTVDLDHKFLFRLRKLGFTLRTGTTEHPGLHFCRFIAFRESMRELPVYLEFIHIGRGGKMMRRPGLSFRALGSLERATEKLRQSGLNGNLIHKNYDWKKGGRDRRPGWNFLTFKKLGFKSLFPWVTEYEPRSDAKKRSVEVQKHRNGVRRIIALDIEVNKNGRRFLEKLLGRSTKKFIRLAGGQTLYFHEGKSTRIKSIILEADSDQKLKPFKFDGQAYWRGRRAHVIKNLIHAWDLLIVVKK